MKYDFVVIDFETATRHLDSACQVGIVAIKDLHIADYYESLIQPPKNYYEENNIDVHGITPEQTCNKPTLNELWPEISQYFLEHVPVIAHNAHFDMSVLRLSASVEIPNFTYVDSIQIFSKYIDGSLSLAHCAEVFGLEMEKHHDALSDAYSVAEMLIAILKYEKCESMWEYLAWNRLADPKLFSELKPRYTIEKTSRKKAAYHTYSNSPKDFVANCEVNPNSPLYGKNIVFTGELSISRDEAYQLAVNCGAVIKTGVSRKIDYLVVGVQDKSLVGDDGLSGKQETALKLNSEGKATIEILDEEAFLSMLKQEG